MLELVFRVARLVMLVYLFCSMTSLLFFGGRFLSSCQVLIAMCCARWFGSLIGKRANMDKPSV